MPTFTEAFHDAFQKAKETNPDLTQDEFARMAWDAKSKTWRFSWNEEVPPLGSQKMPEDAKGIIGLAVLIGLGVFWWTGLYDQVTDTLFYMVEYGINASDISFDTRPTNCDWSDPPIGPKGCHYKKLVIETDVNGRQWRKHSETRPRPFARTREIAVQWEMVND